ncbi:hypothetical protein C7S18_16785 [Ahniella affigens]|uniref:Phosphodiesterase n=1 Tax=Ahniella affigens TaxID=2021234 RepID=A0A2P1PV92_9GAMM|nr:hypothetical protein [Ahniella affigens]AVP98742.1 hypothetical protein C7S18_16785 [Ahniella affigens]
MPRFSSFVLGLTLISALSPTYADTLLIERQERAQGVMHPAKGMLKSQVEQQYGAPVSKSDPVGQPPISKWDYGSFTVYFENDHVITSVLNKSSAREQGPKPAQ